MDEKNKRPRQIDGSITPGLEGAARTDSHVRFPSAGRFSAKSQGAPKAEKTEQTEGESLG